MTRTKAYVSVIPMPDGIFRATCPSIAGVHADGATPEEAEQNLLDMLENRIEHGPLGARDPIEVDPDETLNTVEL